MSKPKLALIVTDPITVIAFFQVHIKHLSKDYDIHLFAGWHSKLLDTLPVTLFVTGARREPSVFTDLKAVAFLIKKLSWLEPEIVLTVTPKAALLGQVAAKLAGVQERIHYFTGQVWVTKTGSVRFALKAVDRLVATLTTISLADSASQREFLIQQQVIGPEKIRVLANGSISGVDSERFAPSTSKRDSVRKSLSIDPDACVFLFLGRLNVDKGVENLLAAHAQLPLSSYLLLVGPCEDEALLQRLPVNAQHVPFTDRPEDFFAASDVFVLFSKREGFGTSALEASSAGLPVVASKIYGLSDAVVDGETGILVSVGDVKGHQAALRQLLDSPELRQKMGLAGRKRAVESFNSDRCARALKEFLAKGATDA